MLIDPYVENILIRERIAEARRDGARRQLLHAARRDRGQRRPAAAVSHLIEAISTLWPRSRRERTATR